MLFNYQNFTKKKPSGLFNYQNFTKNNTTKKPSEFVRDPSQLTTTTASRQPSYVYDYKRTSSIPQIPSTMHGQWEIRRQTREQANRPDVPAFVPASRNFFKWEGVTPSVNQSRVYDIATKPAGWDPTASQFPWQLRRGISSDASRQAAFRFGFGSGEGRTGFARRATDVFMDPRYMFDKNFKTWESQQRQRRQYGL